jgi:[ribosomal protein S18]-alanine N-acetyltransferase
VEIENASFDEPYPFGLFLAFLNDLPHGFRVVVAEESHVIGYCVLSHSREPGVLIISSIAVDPNFRRLGVGKLLLEDTIKIAEELSALTIVKKIVLQVAIENSIAQLLYSKYNFKAEKRKLRNYYGEGRDGVQMVLTLRS